ncbi:MAG: beta strand repeat-containing protein, partial [Rhodospirillaceae bacterium]
LVIDGGAAFHLTANASVAPMLQLGQYGGGGAASITHSASQTLTITNWLDARQGTVNVDVITVSGATLEVTNNSGQSVTFNGNITNQSGGTVLVHGTIAGDTNAAGAFILDNSGTITLTNTYTSAQNAALGGAGATINNLSGGVFNVSFGSAGTAGSRTVTGTFTNTGTVNIGTSATFNGTFTNNATLNFTATNTFNIGSNSLTNTGSGAINVTAGTTTFTGSFASIDNSSTITVSPGATLSIGTGITVTNQSGADYGGGGTISIASGGTFTTAINVAMADTFTIAGTVTVSDATFQVTGTNTISAGGVLRIEDKASGTNTIYASTVPMTNNGTILLTSSASGTTQSILYADNHLITNASGGVLQVDTGVGGGREVWGDLTNAAGGTITLNTGTDFYLTNSDLSNSGTINISAGTASLIGHGAQNHSGGQLTVASGANLVMGGQSITNDSGGTITVNGAIWMGDGPGGDTVGGVGAFFTNSSGATIAGSGAIHLEGATFVPLGTSSITPGLSPGHLTLDGSTIFGAGVNTVMELAGTGANQHDVLTVTDHFTLGGTLSVVDYHGFAAQAGDSFRVFEYGLHDGIFDQAVGLDSFGLVAMDILFDDTGATLVARTITAEGTEGSDALTGTSAGDVLVGRGGDDILTGGGGDDLLLGGEGTNTLTGGAGADRLIGGTGADTADYSADPAGVTVDLSKGFALDGWGGHDTLISMENVTGSQFADTIIGNAKDNVIKGNGGADILTGGAGADTFVLNSPNAIASTITDFVSGQDKIQLDMSGFNFAQGTAQDGINFSVLATHFDGSLAGANTAFAGSQPSLIYSEADSTLYFDVNGAQEGYTAVAHFQAGAHLVASDVRVVDHLMA